MNNTFLISTIDFDTHPNLKETSCFYLLNGDISDSNQAEGDSFVQNLPSNELCVDLPTGYSLLKSKLIDNSRHVLFLKGETTSAIYQFNAETCVINKIVESECLNFGDTIDVVTKKSNTGWVVYFATGDNPVRFLNIDCPYPRKQVEECPTCSPIYIEELDCDELDLNKKVKYPNVNVEVVQGNLPDGVYQIALAPSNRIDELNDYLVYHKTYNLHPIGGNYERFGLSVEIDPCFAGYDQYKVVLISHKDGVTGFQIVGTFDSTQKKVLITEFSTEYYKPISNEEINLTRPKYKSAKFLGANSGHLVIGGIENYPELLYQPQANLITAEWALLKVPANRAHLYPSFMRDEVYALNIQGVHKSGRFSPWFHISNSDNILDEYFDLINNSDTWTDPCTNQSYPRWSVYNTATVTEVYEYSDNGNQIITTNNTDVDCLSYTFSGDNDHLAMEFTYDDCSGNSITEFGILKDQIICTKTPETIVITPRPFDQDIDLIPIGEPCDNGVALCYQYRFSDVYENTIASVEVRSCSVEEGCNYDEVYDGNLSGYIFCSCATDVGTIIITVTIPVPTYDLLGDCSTNFVQEDSDGICDYSLVAKGKFAYHESTIKYPNSENFTTLPNTTNPCKTGIRHHKFPDHSLIVENPDTLDLIPITHIHNDTANAFSQEYVYVLGVIINNIEKPKDCNGDYLEDWIGFRIGVGDRTNNKSVLHKGMIFNMFEENLPSGVDCNDISLYPNYPFNDLNPDIFIGSKEFLNYKNSILDPTMSGGYFGDFEPMSNYRKDKFQYISPDIQYEQNDNSGTYIRLYTEENGYIRGLFEEEERFPKVTLLSFNSYTLIAAIGVLAGALALAAQVGESAFNSTITAVNLSLDLLKGLNSVNYSFRSILESNYSRFNTTNIIETNLRRKIEYSQYLQPIKQLVNSEKINNFQREGGIYLKLNSEILDPFVEENSRIKYGNPNPLSNDNSEGVCNTEFADVTQTKYRTSSYYVGIKKENPNQYGGLNDYHVRPISDVIYFTENIMSSGVLIGGDIYITKHKYLRKFPFFTNLPLDAPDDTTFLTSPYSNVGYPKYYFDNQDRNDYLNVVVSSLNIISLTTNLIPNNYNFDETGKITKKNCAEIEDCEGIYAFRETGKFYTHIIGIVDYWCESEYIAPYREKGLLEQSYPYKNINTIGKYENMVQPEQFLYNIQHKWDGLISKQRTADFTEDCCSIKKLEKDELILVSQKEDLYDRDDDWRVFLPRDIQVFSPNDGELQGIKSMDDYNLLFFFDDAAYATQPRESIYVNQDRRAYLGQGSLFEGGLKKISSEINGLGGCIDPDSFVNTPYGSYWVDRKRKGIIYYDGSKISNINQGIRSWSNEFVTDSILGTYDPFNNNVYFSSSNWNMHYKADNKKLISFHTWIPQWSFSDHYAFFSVKDDKIWKHNSLGSYQKFYGNIEPFEVGFIISEKFKSFTLQNVQIYSEWYKTKNFFTHIHENSKKPFFNKLIAYNNYCSTGIQNIIVKNENPEYNLIDLVKNNQIECTQVEDEVYRINGFRNIGSGSSLLTIEDPIRFKHINTNQNNIESNNGLVRGKFVKMHLINDKHTDYKILVQLNLNLLDETII